MSIFAHAKLIWPLRYKCCVHLIQLIKLNSKVATYSGDEVITTQLGRREKLSLVSKTNLFQPT